jgi:CRP-like cAMP-binding protein
MRETDSIQKEGPMSVESLKRDEVFEFLRPDQVDALSNAARLVRFGTGQIIYQKGEPAQNIYIVLSGQVSIRLPGDRGVSVMIDELTQGDIFGSCVSFALDSYVLTAQCTDDCELLCIKASALKELLEEDPRMGYAIQSKISEIYFRRYVEAMNKLQAIVMNIPLRYN